MPEPDVVATGVDVGAVVPTPTETPPTVVPPENRIAELERKLADAEYRRGLAEQQFQASRPAPVASDDDPELTAQLAYFDAETQSRLKGIVSKMVARDARKVAQAVASEVLTQADQAQRLTDNPALVAEARIQLQQLQGHPVFRALPEMALTALAMAQAEAALLKKNISQLRPPNTTSLPSTTSQRVPTQGEKDKFVADFIANPGNRHWCKRLHKLDPDSEEGKKRLTEAALDEFEQGATYYSSSSAVGQALRQLSRARVE